jgi:hypothetical protein
MIEIRDNIKSIMGGLAARLKQFNRGTIGYDGLARTVASTALAELKSRIHEQGKAADGSDIGRYSTVPIYISVKSNPGRSFGLPTGKTGRYVFESGKKEGQRHASKYFPGGYNQYKIEIGRNTLGKVNFSLSGQMNSQFTIQPSSNGYGVGWGDTEFTDRAKGFELKYGKKIWTLSKDELQLVKDVAKRYVTDALFK